MNDKVSDDRTIPVMRPETFDILQQTLLWFRVSELLPPEMSNVYGAVKRPVRDNMVLARPGQTHYLSLEIVYRNGCARQWQDSHREWVEVLWWAALPKSSVITLDDV